MTYGTTTNCRLIGVKLKADVIATSGRIRTIRAEMEYIEYDLTTLAAPYVLDTWAHFDGARRQSRQVLNIDVEGEWEVTGWIQARVEEVAAIGRRLRIGDQVKFSNRDEWFLLGKVEDDSGIYGDVPHQKFNLLRSKKV